MALLAVLGMQLVVDRFFAGRVPPTSSHDDRIIRVCLASQHHQNHHSIHGEKGSRAVQANTLRRESVQNMAHCDIHSPGRRSDTPRSRSRRRPSPPSTANSLSAQRLYVQLNTLASPASPLVPFITARNCSVHAAGVGSDTAAVYIHAPAIHRDAHTLAALTAKRHAGAACNEPTSPAARRNQAVAVRHRRRRQLPLRRELPVVTPPLVAFVSTSLCQHRQLRPAHSCAATMELVRHRLPTANPPLTACRSSTGCDGLRGPGTPWLQSVRCASSERLRAPSVPPTCRASRARFP